MPKNASKSTKSTPALRWHSLLRIGDIAVFIIATLATLLIFYFLWSSAPAHTLRIRMDNQIIGEYSLNQTKSIPVNGAIGKAEIEIQQGKVRFRKAPCTRQYCVHQGWLSHANQLTICLPNHLSIELIGDNKPFDTLNY